MPPTTATVLIVDDEPAVTETFARMLTLEGFEARTACDGETGLREADASRPQVIFVDLRMPGVDGIEFLRRLRERSTHRDTPVAVLTGDYFLDESVVKALRDCKATLYFKPIWLTDLVRITHTLLGGTATGMPLPRVAASIRLHLLLVDDCIAERDLYAMTLEPTFGISTAARGDEGIALAKAEHPDAVVLDVMMPGMDGWETCSRIKAHPGTAGIPVILLTGADDRDLSAHAKAVGASALLRKPCPADRLVDTIMDALGAASPRASL